MEEAQHARIDALHLRRIASALSVRELQQSLVEVEVILQHLRCVVEEQDALDVQSFRQQRSTPLSDSQERQLLEALNRESRWTFFDSGLEHQAFQALCQELFPEELNAPVRAIAVA
jgi:hypothetical protein